MNEKISEVLARGICSFAVGIDRNRDGHGQLTQQQPSEPCEEICDYCRLQGAYQATLIRLYLREET